MTEEQKKELEKQYNYYSYEKQYYKINGCNKQEIQKYIYKMSALESAVHSLGYTFKNKNMEEIEGCKYIAYELITHKQWQKSFK